MVLIGDEQREDQEILLLSMDRWSQRQILDKLMLLEKLAESMGRGTFGAATRQVCLEARAVSVALQAWLRQAIPPAGYLEMEAKVDE